MAQRGSVPVDGKLGSVYIGRHLDEGRHPSGYYIIASAVKQPVQQRIKVENAKFPTTELIQSFETKDPGAAGKQSRARLCAIEIGMIRGFPDRRKPPSDSEWLFNEESKKEDVLVACVRDTCAEFNE